MKEQKNFTKAVTAAEEHVAVSGRAHRTRAAAVGPVLRRVGQLRIFCYEDLWCHLVWRQRRSASGAQAAWTFSYEREELGKDEIPNTSGSVFHHNADFLAGAMASVILTPF